MAGLLVVLPFAVDQSLMFPTQNAKYFLFVSVVLVVAILVLVDIILSGCKAGLHVTLPDVLLGLLCCYMAVRVFMDMGSYGLSQRFIELCGLAVLYLVIRRQVQPVFDILLAALMLSGMAQAIYGNFQLYDVFPSNHNVFKITGGFFNPGPYAGFLAIVFPIALVTYLNNRDFGASKSLLHASFSESCAGNPEGSFYTGFMRKFSLFRPLVLKYISILTIISVLMVLPATRSRAAWLAVVVSTAIILGDRYQLINQIRSKVDTRVKKIALIGVTLFLLGMASVGLYAMKKESADGRLLIWEITAEMIRERPLFGFGYDRFKAHYLNFQADYFAKNTNTEEALVADNSTRAFNEYLQFAAELGIFGLMITLILGYTLFSGKGKTEESMHLQAAKMFLLAFGVFALFSYPAEILPIKVALVICLAVVSRHQRSVAFGFMRNNSGKTIRLVTIAGSITGLLMAAFLIKPFLDQYQSNRQWKRAYLTYQMGAYQACIQEYEKAFDQLKCNGDYLVNYGKACSMAGEHQKVIALLTRAKEFLPNSIAYTALGDSYKALGQIGMAEQSYIRAGQLLPDRLYPKYLLAKLYDETNQTAKALSIAKELLSKEIKIESMAVQEITAEMQAIVDKMKRNS